MEFPTKGKTKTWGLTDLKLTEYRESFPGLNIDAELRKARQWCRDNSAKRKTGRGMTRFLGTWLSRANDSGRGRSSAGAYRDHTVSSPEDFDREANSEPDNRC